MAWTAPRTWLAGEKPTAATMNLHIRDNQLFLKDGLGGAHINYKQSTTQSLTTAVITKITNLAAVDVGADITYSAGDFTVAKAGVYICSESIAFSANVTGVRYLYIYVNGVATARSQTVPDAVSAGVTLARSFRLVASDVVAMYGYQSSGGNLTTSGDYLTAISLTRIGA